ncbi:MAG TPA: hypothetical protein VKX96_09665 [Chloroflexota bacterium]|nr:hypothetical protein [Chloroflexota bacterium]
MGDTGDATLAEFVQYLPRIQGLNLSRQDLEKIRVRSEPASDQEFLSLGELPPGAPPIGRDLFPFIGSRQLFVVRSDIPSDLWYRLANALAPHKPSGSGGTGMFGNDEEVWVDEENPQLSWRQIDAGQEMPPGPPEL